MNLTTPLKIIELKEESREELEKELKYWESYLKNFFDASSKNCLDLEGAYSVSYLVEYIKYLLKYDLSKRNY